MRFKLLVAMIVLACCATPRSAQAQLTKKITAAVKQKAEERKTASENHIAGQTALAADSVMGRLASVVDSSASRLSSKAAAFAGRVGTKGPAESKESARIRKELKNGRTDLAGVTFATGKSTIPVEAQSLLEALGQAIVREKLTVLIQGRADTKTTRAKVSSLASQRAQAVKKWLAAWGLPPERLLVAADGAVQPGGSYITVLRTQ